MVFHRKDHLVQHLRLVHQLTSVPLIDDWKFDGGPVTSRCGFCDERMRTWDERTSHLAEHFRKGLTMSEWQGDHEFEISVAAKIRNAIPPYCIGPESHALVPFMTADLAIQGHFNQTSSATRGMDLQPREVEPADFPVGLSTLATANQRSDAMTINPEVYTDMLAIHLARLAREQIHQGIIPADETFQREARRVIYGSEWGGWNPTVADNEYWLAFFKGRGDFLQ